MPFFLKDGLKVMAKMIRISNLFIDKVFGVELISKLRENGLDEFSMVTALSCKNLYLLLFSILTTLNFEKVQLDTDLIIFSFSFSKPRRICRNPWCR